MGRSSRVARQKLDLRAEAERCLGPEHGWAPCGHPYEVDGQGGLIAACEVRPGVNEGLSRVERKSVAK
jgi:hypothetical protein